MRNAAGAPLGTWTGQRILRHGGGFVTQLDIASDGTAIIGCDSHGCYSHKPTDSEWQPVITVSQLPAGDVDINLRVLGSDGTGGSFAVAIAHSDSTRAYFCYNGLLYRFNMTTRAATRCGLVQKNLICNTGPQRTYSRKLVVDNQNKDVLLFGTHDGVYYSTDGGTTMTSVSAPACDNDPNNGASGGPYPYPHLVEVDPTSTVSGGIRQKWYHYVSAATGGGLYQSTTGPGGPYSLVTGGPTTAQFMRFDQTGRLWVCDNGTSATNVWSWTSAGGWVNYTGIPNDGGASCSVAVNPANSSNIITTQGNGNIAQSIDNGTTWTYFDSSLHAISVATTQAYLATPYGIHYENMTTGGIMFNPAGTNELWRNWGYGISKTVLPSSLGDFRWTEFVQGVDQANTTELIYPPGVGLIGGFLDLGTWKLDDFTRCNNRPKVPQNPNDDWRLTPPFINQPTNAIGYAADNPNYIATLTSNGYWGFQPACVGTVANPVLTAGNVFSITVNGTTTNITLSGTTIASLENDVLTANPYGMVPGDDGAGHFQMISSTGYAFTVANVAGTPLNTLGITPGTFATTGFFVTAPKPNPHHGYSLDGGKTWSFFPTVPFDEVTALTPFGGQMAVGPQGIIIIAWSGRRTIIRSKDNGVTWAKLPWVGLPPSGTYNGVGDFGSAFFKKNICYDVAGSAFYFYSDGPDTDATKAGVWKSTDNGDTWTQVHAGQFTLAHYHTRLRPVPGKAGNLFFSAGMDQNTPMIRSTDGGVTWNAVPNTAYINDVAFSSFPGGSYPAIMVFGEVSGVGGYHVSYDNCATWTHLGYLGDWADWPRVLCGNPDKLEFYAGFGNSGVMRIAIAHQLTMS